MRLICPNCGAQYEVPDNVIPADGRDVQCSNCGHTWLERPGASVAAEEAPVAPPPQVSVAETLTKTTADVSPDPAPEIAQPDAPYAGSIADAFADIAPEDPPASLPDTVSDFEAAEGETPPTEAPKRRPVDASVAAILQEEAARETAARQAEAQTGLESQTDLGLDDTTPAPKPRDPAPEPAVSDAPDAQDAPDDGSIEAAVAATVAGSRRELLPDIEEINSSLRSNAERGEEDIAEPEEIEAEKRRGFRTGFLLVLLIFAVCAAVYVFAPQIAEAVPALAGALDAYVEAVDAGRIWLDIKANELLEMIRPATDG